MQRKEKAAGEVNLTPDNSPYRGKIAVVVGGGPAGLTAAIYLSRIGFDVKVYESRDDTRRSEAEKKRSYSIGLISSVAQVMREIGVKFPTEGDQHVNGFVRFHGKRHIFEDGTVRQVELPPNRFMGTRASITTSLLEAIAERYSDNVTLHFLHKCKGVDFKEQRIAVEDPHGHSLVQSYDLLVAADGAHSVVRNELMEFDKSLTTEIVPNRSRYLVVDDFTMPDSENVYTKSIGMSWVIVIPLRVPPGQEETRMGEIFIFQMPDGGVRIRTSGPISVFETIKQEGLSMARQILPKNLPEEWTERIYKVIKTSEKIFTLPSIIHVSKFNGPSTVLIGDAAHGMSPNTAQGCTLAIEDGRVLCEMLKTVNGDIDQALKLFNDERHEEVQCCLMMEEGFSRYLLVLTGWRLLWRYVVKMHLMYRALSARLFRHIPKSTAGATTAKEAIWAIKRDCLMLCTLVLGGIVLLLALLFRLVHAL